MKKNKFNIISDINYISKLTSIKTFGQLKQYVGKLLIMGYLQKGELVLWAGILNDNFLNKHEDYENVGHKSIYTEDFLFLVQRNSLCDIYNPLQKFKFCYQSDIRHHNAQTFIVIPDKRLITYYNLCKLVLNNYKNEKKI